MPSWLLVLTGLAALLLGAELLVRGASAIAGRLGMPPLIIGLTVVAWGTSAPEAAVGIGAALAGNGELVLGNVIGSNLFNTLVILGLSALIVPLGVQRSLIRRDIPLMLLATLAVFGLGLLGSAGRIAGVLLLAAMLLYTLWLLRGARRETPGGDSAATRPPGGRRLLPAALLALTGLALLATGARWLVGGASGIAAAAGISERIIGLTIVAGGTSLPELAASVVAGLRGERDIAVGNVVGSNLFNLLGVLGLSALVAPQAILLSPAVTGLDLPVLLLCSLAVLPLAISGTRIDRTEGALLLATYAGYLAWVLTHPGAAWRDELAAALLVAASLAGLVLLLLTLRRHFARAQRPGS